jgi:pimeloyl-ACP methyl ester carboxylesterase
MNWLERLLLIRGPSALSTITPLTVVRVKGKPTSLFGVKLRLIPIGGVPSMTAQKVQPHARPTERLVVGPLSHAEGLCRAVSAVAFATARGLPGSARGRAVGNAVVGRTYPGVRAALLASIGLAGGLASKITASPDTMRRRTNLAISALNAAIGDRLVDSDSSLAIHMALRSDGQDLPALPGALATAYPDATCKLAVFLHGLGETENSWKLHGGRSDREVTITYGSRLAADAGFTPLYLRYNTGLHISDNGKLLADLLTAVFSAWPTSIEEVIMVGHSMGGLVARSACYYGERTGDPWIPGVRHVFYLGSPHLGAPLERLASYFTWALSSTELTRPVASLINRRSAGIKDLRFGYVVHDDWSDYDPDACLRSHRHNVPLLSSAEHYSISATISSGQRHPLGWIFGDLLVPPASAHGHHPHNRNVNFPRDHRYHLGNSHHFDLLNHPDVYGVMDACLRPRRPSLPPQAAHGPPPSTGSGEVGPTERSG